MLSRPSCGINLVMRTGGLMRHERPRAPVLGGQSALVMEALTRSPERLESAAGRHQVDRRRSASRRPRRRPA